jgi:STE24 endopeptidase
VIDRRVAERVAVLAAVAFISLAAVLVPWSPVPGGMPDPVPAGEVFSAAEIARAESYARTARLIGWSALAVGTLVSCLLGFTPLGARLLGRRRWPWPVAVVGLVAAVLVIGRLVALPFAMTAHDHRVDNGLSNQPWGAWFVDQGKGLGVSVAFTSLALLGLVWCARRWRTWWPAVAGVLAAGLVAASSFLYPVLVEPVFNEFARLPDGELRSAILEVAEREDVGVDEVLVADASRRTTTLNAYVSGYGDTRRVVVYDNLVEDLPQDQALSVVAHELAHAKNDDVVVGTALGAAGAVLGVGLIGVLVGSSRLRHRSGIEGVADPRCVALVLALVAVGGLVSSPVENGISRHVETRADVDALKATGDPVAFSATQRRLALRSLADPTPPAWSQFWFGSHPTVLERVALGAE